MLSRNMCLFPAIDYDKVASSQILNPLLGDLQPTLA
jgi:hypothetical protein